MELNRDNVLKALECCKWDDVSLCKQCPYYKPSESNCISNMSIDALSLIKELTEENTFLHKTITENAQLALEVTLEEIEKAKADTVNKMYSMIKERCIKGGIYPIFVARTITLVAKEILEETK